MYDMLPLKQDLNRISTESDVNNGNNNQQNVLRGKKNDLQYKRRYGSGM